MLSIFYSRYLRPIAPLYLAGLLLVHGLLYFVVAQSVHARMRWLLSVLSLLVLMGGGTLVLFTLGFEIVLTLAQASGITLLLSCTYELAAYLIDRKSNNGHMEREELK